MVYSKQNWADGQTITAARLNAMDDGIENSTKISKFTVDYSKVDFAPNLIDDTRLVEGKSYREDGLVEEASQESLGYLIPVKNGDTVYQTRGYAHLAFYNENGEFVYDTETEADPYVITNEQPVAFMGVTIYTGSGSTLRNRVLRVNHPISGEHVPGNTDWILWAQGKAEENNDDKTIVLLDFDQPPTDKSDLRFTIMKEYGWYPTTPYPLNSNADFMEFLISSGWSFSAYLAYDDPDDMKGNGWNPEYVEKFNSYVDKCFNDMYTHGFFSPTQWSACQNSITPNLVSALKRYGVPLIRGNWDPYDKGVQDDGNIVRVQAHGITDSSSLEAMKNAINSGNYSVYNIFTHKILPDAEVHADPYSTSESVYRGLCEYLKEMEESNKVVVTNSTRWFAEAYPGRVKQYMDICLRNTSKYLTSKNTPTA